jgi:uncharacterized protein (TIGR02271 family)
MTDTSSQQDLSGWIGHDLIDEGGSTIGRIDDIYVDEETRKPEWVAVTTGMFGSRVSFVPLEGLSSDGESLISPWDKAKVKDAPHAEPDGNLSQDEEAALYRHYGFGYGENRSDTGLPEGGTGQVAGGVGDTEGPDTARMATEARDTGHDTSGPTTDDAMTRSEEELNVGTTEREAGRVRLRKWIETDQQTVTVPVRKEKVQVIREPITDANIGKAMDGPDLSEEEHEIVLTEEEVVVDKKVVPKERVHLDKDVVVEDEQVSAELRKERIETEGDTQAGTRPT